MVTVLMSVYNAPLPLLNAAIDSILAQTHADFEFLIIDDGSDCQEARAFLARKSLADPRIRVAWEPHRGLTASLNRGLELAGGEFIARQDADDWSSPHRLEHQLAHLHQHPGDAVCGSDAWMHQHNGRKLWRTHLPQSRDELLCAFPRRNPFVHGAVMFRKAAALAEGGYCEHFPCSQDYDLFWRMTERYGAVNLSMPLYHYRYTGGSVSANKAAEQLRAHDAIRVLAAARQRGESQEPSLALARSSAVDNGHGLVRALLKQADHCMLAGDYRRAARSYLGLVANHPGNPLAWAKLIRLGVFRIAPFLREACFR
ncbi:MAG: glycosyltransferase [Acidobacteriota bacterium]